MNGQPGNDAANQAGHGAQLAFLLNAAGQNGLMGLQGAMAQGGGNSSLEEQILQRASSLRAEALMQQQQHEQQRHQQLGTLAAIQQQQSVVQQQQQLASLVGLNPNFRGAMGAQEQEALFARAVALRELGINIGGAPAPGGLHLGAPSQGASAMERLQQLEYGRLEDLDRRRQELAALASLSDRELPNTMLSNDSIKRNSPDDDRLAAALSAGKPRCTVVGEKSKEDLRKTPGTVIVPCRARGMPMDHNFKTAYFVISEDAKHGEDLVCSYFACRNGGVKFRYCAHCMAPVAKRNFCRRHDHGMSKANEVEKKEDDIEPKTTESKSLSESSKKNEILKSSLNVLTNAATSKFLDNSKKRKKPSAEDMKDNDDTKDSGDDMNMESSNAPSNDSLIEGERSQGLSSISAERKKLWTELLPRRPRTKDPRHLSAWLNEVLTVSDFDIPLDQIELPPAPIIDPELAPDEENATSPINNGAKETSPEKPSSPKNGEDGFVGSFADWRDRKREKLLKKGTGSLRN